MCSLHPSTCFGTSPAIYSSRCKERIHINVTVIALTTTSLFFPLPTAYYHDHHLCTSPDTARIGEHLSSCMCIVFCTGSRVDNMVSTCGLCTVSLLLTFVPVYFFHGTCFPAVQSQHFTADDIVSGLKTRHLKPETVHAVVPQDIGKVFHSWHLPTPHVAMAQ